MLDFFKTIFFLKPVEKFMVPQNNKSTKSLILIIAIMYLLAGIALIGAKIIHSFVESWQNPFIQEATIQIYPTPKEDMDKSLKKISYIIQNFPFIQSSKIIDKAETKKLLKPWLDNEINIDESILPQMVILNFSKNHKIDFLHLEKIIQENVPGAQFNNPKKWIQKVTFIGYIGSISASSIIIFLFLVSNSIIILAMRSALFTNISLIKALDFMGASNHFIAHQFLIYFWVISLKSTFLGVISTLCLFLGFKFWSSYFLSAIIEKKFFDFFGSISLNGSDIFISLFYILSIVGITNFISYKLTINYLKKIN